MESSVFATAGQARDPRIMVIAEFIT